MKKVVFLSDDSKYSAKAFKIISKYQFNLVKKHIDVKEFTDYPGKYDLGISFLYPHLVPKNEINKSKWINFHPSILPNYRGRNIAYHTIMNNENESGGTIHFMDQTFDTGNIIEVKKFNIKNMTAYDIYNNACVVLLDLLKKYFPLLLKGENIETYKQSKGHYYKKTDINDFIKISEDNKKKILALTYPPHHPKIKIGNKVFKILGEEITK